MDRGTNAVPYIRGDVIPLSLGYVGALLHFARASCTRSACG